MGRLRVSSEAQSALIDFDFAHATREEKSEWFKFLNKALIIWQAQDTYRQLARPVFAYSTPMSFTTISAIVAGRRGKATLWEEDDGKEERQKGVNSGRKL